MYVVTTNDVDIAKLLPMFFAIILGIAAILLIVLYFVKRQDNNKELIVKKVKILEKPVQQGSIEWYVVECEDGERLKLRSFQANRIMITVGDTGIISYKGQTIQDFKRNL